MILWFYGLPIYTIGYHLISLCRDRLLRAKCDSMKRYISKCQQKNGSEFNKCVYYFET